MKEGCRSPNLTYLKNQAHDLLKAYAAGDVHAQRRCMACFPGSSKSSQLVLAQALFVLANEYGFES